MQKDQGIQIIAKRITKSEIATFGNSYNDLSMLKYVGLPTVMDNATLKVKFAVKYITKNNDENEVAYSIKHFIEEVR